MHPAQTLPPLRPICHHHGELESTSFTTKIGQNGSVVHVAVFEYPDCTRTYDGNRWEVVKDKRQQ